MEWFQFQMASEYVTLSPDLFKYHPENAQINLNSDAVPGIQMVGPFNYQTLNFLDFGCV